MRIWNGRNINDVRIVAFVDEQGRIIDENGVGPVITDPKISDIRPVAIVNESGEICE